MLHIKLKRMEHRAQYNIVSHPWPWGWVKRSKYMFSECGHFANNIKGKEV